MKYVLAIFPSAGVLFLFWLAIKSLFEADRRERAAEARMNRPDGPTTASAPAKDTGTQSRDRD